MRNVNTIFVFQPLDSLFRAAGSGPAPPTVLPVAPKKIPVSHGPVYNSNKPSRNEPCIFFQKGHCLKGERCPFTHEPTSANVPQQMAKASPSLLEQPQVVKKEPWGIKQGTNPQNIPRVSVDVALTTPASSAKPFIGLEGLSHSEIMSPRRSGNKLPKSQLVHAHAVNNNSWSRDQNLHIHPSDDHPQNGLEPGEIVGEHSSEFNVHVDNRMKDSGHFHNGDESGRKTAHGGRKLDPFKDHGYCPSDDKLASIYKRNEFSGSVHEFERNGKVQDYYDMGPRRISSERSSERSMLPERRVVQRHKSSDEMDRTDLRHRLKQKKLDGSRSAVGPDRDRQEQYHRDDQNVEDKYRGHYLRRDQPQVSLESFVSTRLRGRISLPISSADSFRKQSEKERDLSRHRVGLSPTRSVANHGRQFGSITRSSEEPPVTASARNLGSKLTKREVDAINFSGPKSLAEIKGVKHVESPQEQSTKSTSDVISHVQSFEGPKPLSVLLKRKREEAAVNCTNSNNVDESNQRNGSAEVCYSDRATCDQEAQPTVEAYEKDKDSHSVDNVGAAKFETVGEESSIPPGDDEFTAGQSSAKEDMSGAEDYMELDAEDQEVQHYDQRDGESDYEATAEYESQGEEEDELDDEEDFARKAGLLFS